MMQGAVRPTGHKKRLAVRIEENPVRPPAGLEAIDHGARLRIHHHDGIMIKIAGIQQVAVGRQRDVADEIPDAPLGGLDYFKGTRRLQRSSVVEREFKNSCLRAATYPQGSSIGGERHSKPGVAYSRAADFMAVLGIEHAE